jgi:hypothetical protein
VPQLLARWCVAVMPAAQTSECATQACSAWVLPALLAISSAQTQRCRPSSTTPTARSSSPLGNSACASLRVAVRLV